MRFWNLIYMVAAAAAVTLVGCLVELSLARPIGAIVSGVSAVVSSSATVLFLRLKESAKRELEQARDAVRCDCVTGGERGSSGTASNAQVTALIDELTGLV